MTESTVSAAKKPKRSASLSRVIGKEREKQFKTEFNADGGCSFVVFANTASTLRTLTLKDHLESKKYAAKKEVQKATNSSSNAPSTNQQMALGMAVKSRDIPCEQSLSLTV